jgi:hypothetical protein
MSPATSSFDATDATDAARLIALGMRPKQLPARDLVYADLVRRYGEDDEFAGLVRAVAEGLGIAVLAVTPSSGRCWRPARSRCSS